jgi:hypothetical protein
MEIQKSIWYEKYINLNVDLFMSILMETELLDIKRRKGATCASV